MYKSLILTYVVLTDKEAHIFSNTLEEHWISLTAKCYISLEIS